MEPKGGFDEAGVMFFYWIDNNIKLGVELGSTHIIDNQLWFSQIEITIISINKIKCEGRPIKRSVSKSFESLMEGEDGTILGYDVSKTDLSFCVYWTKYSPNLSFFRYYEIIGEKIIYAYK